MLIDNFALTMHQTCPAKYELRIREDWAPIRRSAPLGFGAAMHSGLAVWYRTGNLDAAIAEIERVWPPEGEMPLDDYRNLGKARLVMGEYVKEYPKENFSVLRGPDGQEIIEMAFSLPTGMYLRCECGNTSNVAVCPCGVAREPIEYGGIIDLAIDFAGRIYPVEHKTTSRLGAQYHYQFKPNNQITGYMWALTQMLPDQPVAGGMVNAIGVYAKGKTEFQRHTTLRSAFEVEEWKRNVLAACEEIREHERTGYWPMRTSACTLYGLCEFHALHSLGTPKERQNFLELSYRKEHWDFLNRE